ncbi:HAMP domain-containing sensor histidine kinase [Staphylococcus pettenkoferi]|uniref:HAMP domain-containing sensor histidine kinase n=1 Tax=Staphylococcus pettenkoferi TaxID=170573 RepID=UPI0011A44F4B|nr:HAMP domain-containing sensor histidine kinase [Staphylococcus pettenkoferi]
MFKSLYSRIAIYTITVMLISALLSFLLTNVYYHVKLKPSNDAKIMQTLKQARSYQDTLSAEQTDHYFKHLGDMNYQVMTVNQNGDKHYYGERFRKDNVSQKDINHVLSGRDYHGIRDLRYHPFITGFFENVTSNTVGVQFTTDKEKLTVFMRPDIGKTFSEFRVFLAVLLTILLLISIILVISSTYSIIKPVQQLKQATQQLMRGRFDQPIKQTRKDELGTLQHRFDSMRLSLKQLDDMRSHFVQNVSHEIKTPLTHIHQQLGQLQHAETKEERDYHIEEIHQITSQLSNLTKELLLLAELDNGNHLTFNDNIKFNALITEIVRHHQFSADQKDLVILTDLEDVQSKGNEQLLYQAIQNLMSNAIKYSERGGMIEVTLRRDVDQVVLSIADDGQGISEEAQARLFERFYKMSSDDTSNGLGLAIAKTIVELHGGVIEVDSAKGEGTMFVVKLPVNDVN